MSWTKIESEELQRLQERLELPQQSTSLEASTLRTPFYQNGELVRMHDGPGAKFMVAVGQGELSARKYYPLNGASADIHAANEAAGLVITRDNASDYVRFFTTFLRMDNGEPFVILESLNGSRLVSKDRSDQRKPDDMRFVCMGETADGDAFTFKGYWSIRVYYSGCRCASTRTAPLKCWPMIRWGISSGFTDET
jgi:hypothetical protein